MRVVVSPSYRWWTCVVLGCQGLSVSWHCLRRLCGKGGESEVSHWSMVQVVLPFDMIGHKHIVCLQVHSS
uniref:Uncharacterized protein n=1 Tax=Physcomitrium patens TaxID=3218 RepID=A0A2K1L935_PHYPA|nr:hypothetical protein PHYPA_000974 [Physcomitrium patens]